MYEPVPVNGSVPPVADTVTVVVPPLHAIVPALNIAAGCVPLTTQEHRLVLKMADS